MPTNTNTNTNGELMQPIADDRDLARLIFTAFPPINQVNTAILPPEAEATVVAKTPSSTSRLEGSVSEKDGSS